MLILIMVMMLWVGATWCCSALIRMIAIVVCMIQGSGTTRTGIIATWQGTKTAGVTVVNCIRMTAATMNPID